MTSVSVGLFNDSYAPIIDGVTITVKNYAYWLNRLLGPTCVVAPSAPAYKDDDSFPIVRFLSVPTIVHPPYRIGLPRFDCRLQRRIEQHDFSILHAHSPFGAGRAALRSARRMGIPIVATFHSKFRDNLRQAVPIRRLVDKELKRIVDFFYSVDRVWVPQESVAATLREYGYEGPYEVVENGIDYAPPDDLERLRRSGGRLLGVDDDELVGLFVGQHILEKNLEFLLRSLPAVMAAQSRFRMIFVGDGYARQRLCELAARLGMEGRVFFIGPVYDRQLLAAIYARGDLLLFPSLFDNAPLVLREAAAFSTPALVLRGSTSAEVVRDCENGFLSEGEPESFASKILGVLDDPSALERAGRGAQRSLCRSWRDVALEVRERYLSILSGWAA
jgi:glycosyltransferase involved in cell wall biosynthesis